MSGLFVPGWGAVPGLYRRGLPTSWDTFELQSYRAGGGELGPYRRRLNDQIARGDRPLALAGHSMGAALAILAAVDQPTAIERLILLSPAGLPLSKPMTASLATFLAQIVNGWYPAAELSQALSAVLRAPRRALTLARTVHDLDLNPQLALLEAAPIPITVVGCATDELTTPAHCRQVATLLGAAYREVDAPGGHIWMIARPKLLTAVLTDASS